MRKMIIFLLACSLLLIGTTAEARIRNRNVDIKADIDLGKINTEDDPNEHRAASDGYNQFMRMPTVTNANQETASSSIDGAIWYDATDDVLEACIGGAKVNIGGSGGSTAYDDISNPDANGTIDFTTFTNTWDLGVTAGDMFNVTATAAFADISVMTIEQKTGNPTDGTLLELILAAAETDPDYLSCQIGGAEEVNIAAGGAITTISTVTATGLVGYGAGSNANSTIDAKGSGTITLGATSTGDAIFSRDVQLNEDVDLGNAAGDTITFTGTIISDINLDDSATHSPSITFTDESNETLVLQKLDGADATATLAAARSLRIAVGNLRVGNAAATVASMDGEDVFIEGELEVDGAVQFDGAVTLASTFTTSGAVDAPNFTCDASAGLDAQSAGSLLIGAAMATSVEIADSGVTTDIQGPVTVLSGIDTAGTSTLALGAATANLVEISSTGVETDIQGTLSVDEAATFDATVNFDNDIDIDLVLGDQVHISSTDVASGTAGLVVIDDNRAGTNNDVVAEAALVVDSTGTFGASFVDGRVAFATGADLDINTSIDYDTAVAGELINIAGFGDAGIDLVTISKANDGTEAEDGNVLVINDNRTGTEADEKAEASVTINSTGTHALYVELGTATFEGTLDADGAVDIDTPVTQGLLVSATTQDLGASAQNATPILLTIANNTTEGDGFAGISIDDNRAGTEADAEDEAGLLLNSAGTYALNVVAGTAVFNGTLRTDALLDVDHSVDIDVAVGSQVLISNDTSAGDAGVDLVLITMADDGTEANDGNVVVIDDNRTGTEADAVAEAALVVDSTGAFSAHFLDGDVQFSEEADIKIEETGGADLITLVAAAQTTGATASIPDIGGASTFVMSTTQGSAAQSVDGAFDCANLTVDAAAGLDAQSAGTLLLGASMADLVEIADTLIETDIQGTLSVDEAAVFDSTVACTGVLSPNAGTKSSLGVGAVSGGGASVVEWGDGIYHRSIVTVDATGANDIDLEDKDDGNGVILYTFPEGHIRVLGAVSDLTATSSAGIFQATFPMAVGSVIGADGSATLTTTEADFCASTAISYDGAQAAHLPPVSAADMTWDGSTSAVAVYLNAAVGAADINAASTVSTTGTVTLHWMNLGDY